MGDTMSQEVLKAFVIKLLGVSLLTAIAWYMAVKPQTDRLNELRITNATQMIEITQGEEAIADLSDKVIASEGQLDKIREEILVQLDMDQGTNAHKRLQESAELHNLTVTRIEPLRSSIATHKGKSEDQAEIQLETKEFRIECVGPFGGIVGFLNDLSNGEQISKVDSFRIVPVSRAGARMIMQVSIFQFVDTPKVFSEASRSASQQLQDGGDTNGQS
jgi:hypothetical protein